jgi:hypothetical protein
VKPPALWIGTVASLLSVMYSLAEWLAGGMMAAPKLTLSDVAIPLASIAVSVALVVPYLRRVTAPARRRIAWGVVIVAACTAALLLVTVSDMAYRQP